MLTLTHTPTSTRSDAAEVSPADVGDKEHGFTLIELMVVIIIIGILAAIAIPAFLNQRQAAWDASVKTDLSSFAIAAESFATATNGSYTGMTGATLRSTYGLKTTADNLFKIGTVTATSYVVTGYNSNSGVARTYTLTSGNVAGPTTGTAITATD